MQKNANMHYITHESCTLLPFQTEQGLQSLIDFCNFINPQVFFRSLAAHLRTLQQLSVRIPDSASSGWETEVPEVERQVSSVVQQAQAVGTVLHSALQVWDRGNQEIMRNDTSTVFMYGKLHQPRRIGDLWINERTNGNWQIEWPIWPIAAFNIFFS